MPPQPLLYPLIHPFCYVVAIRFDNESLPPFLAGIAETSSWQASRRERGSAIYVDVCYSTPKGNEKGEEKGTFEVGRLVQENSMNYTP